MRRLVSSWSGVDANKFPQLKVIANLIFKYQNPFAPLPEVLPPDMIKSVIHHLHGYETLFRPLPRRVYRTITQHVGQIEVRNLYRRSGDYLRHMIIRYTPDPSLNVNTFPTKIGATISEFLYNERELFDALDSPMSFTPESWRKSWFRRRVNASLLIRNYSPVFFELASIILHRERSKRLKLITDLKPGTAYLALNFKFGSARNRSNRAQRIYKKNNKFDKHIPLLLNFYAATGVDALLFVDKKVLLERVRNYSPPGMVLTPDRTITEYNMPRRLRVAFDRYRGEMEFLLARALFEYEPAVSLRRAHASELWTIEAEKKGLKIIELRKTWPDGIMDTRPPHQIDPPSNSILAGWPDYESLTDFRDRKLRANTERQRWHGRFRFDFRGHILKAEFLKGSRQARLRRLERMARDYPQLAADMLGLGTVKTLAAVSRAIERQQILGPPTNPLASRSSRVPKRSKQSQRSKKAHRRKN